MTYKVSNGTLSLYSLIHSTVSDHKQQNVFGCISLLWSVVLQGHLV